MEHKQAQVNGVRLHYASSGAGSLVLFLHGFPEFWYAWKNQLEEFGKDRHAVAPDMRGYNLSDKPENAEQYAIPLLVADVRALADHLLPPEQNKFALVGHDWGGVVAWAFALAHPEYLEKLVIVNAPHPAIFAREIRSNAEQQKASSYILLFRTAQAEAVLSADNYAVLRKAVFDAAASPGAFTEDDRRAYLQAWSRPGALTGGLNYYRAAKVWPPAPANIPPSEAQAERFRVQAPTLVIWGEKDRALLTGNLDGLDDFVADIRLRRIPNGTHWVIHEQPGLVNRYIREFLEPGTVAATAP